MSTKVVLKAMDTLHLGNRRLAIKAHDGEIGSNLHVTSKTKKQLPSKKEAAFEIRCRRPGMTLTSAESAVSELPGA
jgi:hypothetical protein